MEEVAGANPASWVSLTVAQLDRALKLLDRLLSKTITRSESKNLGYLFIYLDS
jgi:hypothetical protein